MQIHPPSADSQPPVSWRALLRQTLRSRFFIIYAVLIGLFGLVIKILTVKYGAGFITTAALYLQPFDVTLTISVIAFLFFRILYVCLIDRPARPLLALYREFRYRWFTPRRVVQGLAVMILIPVFFSFFTSAKNLMPLINPFSWDPAFAEWDRMIHFGKQPWEWLHPALGAALVTTVISFFYKTWFFSKYMVIFWQAFTLSRPQLRAQFFITMLLTWIVNGFVFALIFSSAGPCFYDYFYPDLENPYDALMQFLHETDKTSKVYDLFAMDYLLHAYDAKKTALFSGISAFPSMHVSVAFLNALLGWRTNRVLGVFFTIYLAIIMVGSVHLGWHYAIDGYFSIITTYLLWKATGRFFRKGEHKHG
ncbi:MAG: phosphatase PAP2 family protein [Micavibrio aeruginosavorus]|uniref:Phosphatase PAP2 family protein n=1 Tax=Micavibrio aeruginosavorus TaxID=349221 RepID=A0A7T5UGY0_9BACT|nr:MAG: phosphatase PAP2 family protein [Micavibrio aeruginosavorus]